MSLPEIYKIAYNLCLFVQKEKNLTISQVEKINQEVKMWVGIMRCMGSSIPGEVIRFHKGEFKTSNPYTEIEQLIDSMHNLKVLDSKEVREFKNIRRAEI